MKYSTGRKNRARYMAVIAAAVLALGFFGGQAALKARAEETIVTLWVMAKPGSYVNVRRTPDKKGEAVGYLDAGDSFRTDGTCADGWIRCIGIGEYGEGWVYSGYVVTHEPEKIGTTYCCVAKKRVACHKWIDGPRTDRPWLVNGSTVQVFMIADGWACTSRGYIHAEWLEEDWT